jgi:hypothetical protein
MPPRKRRRIAPLKEEETKQVSATSKEEETKVSASEIDIDDLRMSAMSTWPEIFDYPDIPADYFNQRRKEIVTSEEGTKELLAIFAPPKAGGLCYIPKILIQLCIAYYYEPMHVFIDRMIGDLQKLEYMGGFKDFGTKIMFTEASVEDRNSFNDTADYFAERAWKYLRWFRMRKLIPERISMNEVNYLNYYDGEDDDTRITGVLIGDKPEIEICGDEFGAIFKVPRLSVGVFDAWDVPFAEGCWSKLIEKYISLRPTENRHKWAIYFYVQFAAIQIWTSDASNFVHLPNAEEVQDKCKRRWNRAYQKCKLGSPFSRF